MENNITMNQYIDFKKEIVNPNIVLSIEEAGQTVDAIKRTLYS